MESEPGRFRAEKEQEETSQSASPRSLQHPESWGRQQENGGEPGHEAGDLQPPRSLRLPQFWTQAVEGSLPPPPASLWAEPDRWFNNAGCLADLVAAEPAETHATPLLWLQGPGLRCRQSPWTAEF